MVLVATGSVLRGVGSVGGGRPGAEAEAVVRRGGLLNVVIQL